MSAENKALIKRWFEEVWNQGRLETVDELFADETIAHGLADAAGNPLRGPNHFKEYVRTMRTAFPDIHFTVEDVLTEGDRAVARCTVRGTHKGEGLGFAPSNQTVVIEGTTIARIENGKIVEGWNYFDFMGLMKQVGAI
jgi:steroid delta-isomerase-like uncharacterized protein